MVSFKVVDNRTNIDRKFQRLRERLSGLENDVLEGVASTLVLYSPVDTGAYMRSHIITEGRSRGGGVSSHGLPRDQPWQSEAQSALNRLFSQIAGIQDFSLATFSNNAPHAAQVENEHGYAVYAKAKDVGQQIKRDAIGKFRSQG